MFENKVKNLYIGKAYDLIKDFQLSGLTCGYLEEEEVTVIKIREENKAKNMPAKYECISSNHYFFGKDLYEVKEPQIGGINNLICVGDYYNQLGMKRLSKVLRKENKSIYEKLEKQKENF